MQTKTYLKQVAVGAIAGLLLIAIYLEAYERGYREGNVKALDRRERIVEKEVQNFREKVRRNNALQA